MRFFILFSLFFFSALSSADDMRPASLTIKAADSSSYDISWTVPLKNGKRPAFSVVFENGNKMLAPKHARQINNTSRESWSINREPDLSGSTILIEGLAGSTYEVLLRIIDEEQQTITAVLNTDKPSFIVPDINTIEAEDTILTYIILGVEHILIGLDHLLFVACLVYISGTRNKLLLTITGFTIAHSITLVLAATEVLTIPILPVEAVIALSIVFLAWEIAKNKKDSLSLKYPILVSSSFGLLHGFGFASVLSDIGLPETEKISALLYFNIGVEIGQLLFIFVLFWVYVLIRVVNSKLNVQNFYKLVSYFSGTVAMIWLISRLQAF